LTGDVHIGRSSSRMPSSAHRGDLRAATTWLRIVDMAIHENVDLVCLSGDVADQDNKFWEAIGPLEQGIRRLAVAGIRTVAVSGNHDFDVLPRLANQLPPEQFILLGRSGKWERHTISQNDKPVLHIDGWSFPSRRVRESPLHGYDLAPDQNTPILGLVHGDLGVADSPYAPLDLQRLQSLPVAGWLLGHIHASRLMHDSGRPWVLYPGSPQALDPGETGRHGAWVVNLESGQLYAPTPLPLSSVRYESLEIDLTDTTDTSELEDRILNGIRRQAALIAAESEPHLVHLSLRLRLVGSTRVSHSVCEVAKSVTEDLSLQFGNASLSIEKTNVETTPAINLEEFATSTHSAPGALARLLLNLEQDDASEETQTLIHRARRKLEQVHRHRDFIPLEKPHISDEMARSYLKTQARSLLTELISQTT